MSMITATAWVPRGYPKQIPSKAEFDEDEFERIQELANLHLEDAQQDLQDARTGKTADKEETSDADGGVTLERTNGSVIPAGGSQQHAEMLTADDHAAKWMTT